MPELTFVTGNADKFSTAFHTGATHGVTIVQAANEIDEVQGEDAEYIARQKAQSAYDMLGKPLIVSDDSWAIPALNGFPGPYMKSMNHYFSVDDFLRLCAELPDRTTYLTKMLVYQDETEQIVFSSQVRGEILREPHGSSTIPWTTIAAMEGDKGLSIAEVYAAADNLAGRKSADIWHEFLTWYKEHKS